MSDPEFVHLHLHTQYSLLDGCLRINNLCEALHRHGMTAAAMTDHGNLFGALEFFKTMRGAGLKPIIGCELYVAPNGRTDRKSPKARSYNHLTVLARDLEGYRNLSMLSTTGYVEGFYYKPRVDKEVIARHSAGLIALSGCAKGVCSVPIVEGDEARAEQELDDYREIFGRENFFLEVQDHGLEDQKKINAGVLRLAQRHDCPVVATNDVHYLNAGDHEAHDVLLCVGTGSVVTDEKRLRYDSDQFYLKSGAEMAALFGSVDGALENTLEVAERCDVEIPTGQRLIPHFDPPKGLTVPEYLRQLVCKGLERRCPPVTEEKLTRIDMELGVIGEMGFESYFLIVWDFMRYAREQGIPVGPGRGSVGGSLVAFCLEITDINPLDYNLMFERFLNIGRITMPDIDIDFCYERRGEVIDYVRRKYGQENVAQIITFGTMKARNAVRDVGRALDVDLATVDEIAKLIPAELKMTIEKALEKEPRLKERYQNNERVRKLLDMARHLEGLSRHCSTHAAGVVIAEKPLTEYLPLYKAPGEEEIVTQFPMEHVEQIGLLKMDFLGLKNLTIIENTIRTIERLHGVKIDWTEIDQNDPDTFKTLQAGDTFGVFQLESSGMQNYLRKLRPERFEDIIAMNALYRPGPLGAGMVDEYINRKHGLNKVVYHHDSLKPILEETYGVIVYQEQVARIANVMAGYTLSEADLLRRAMGKKKESVMAEQEEIFVEKATKKGIEEKTARATFEEMAFFAGYGFNKSHSAAYAVIAFRTAYLKTHYPVEYMAALMTNDMGNSDRMPLHFVQCRSMGIKILPPDVNESERDFTVVGKNVRFGLGAVKNVGHGAVDGIIAARMKGGPFQSLQDFCERVELRSMNARMIACLIKAGACDSLGGHRAQLIEALEDVLEGASRAQKERESGQSSLFQFVAESEGAPEQMASIELPDVPPWSMREALQQEKEQIGFYVSGHPLDEYEIDFRSFANSSIRDFCEKGMDGGETQLLGEIKKVSRRPDRKGNLMAFFDLEDFSGQVGCIAFSKAHDQYGDLIQEDAIAYVVGTPNSRDGELVKCQVKQIFSADDFRRENARFLELALDGEHLTRGNLESLLKTLKKYRGPMGVRLQVPFGKEGHRLLLEAGREIRVDPSTALMERLQEFPGIKRLTYS